MSHTINLLDIVEETTVDGPGFRTSIYCSGCQHHCPGCHNPQSWDKDAGHPVDVEVLAERILDDPFVNVTYSGGDPMYQPKAFAELSRILKKRSKKTIWCYTGFTYEALVEMPEQRELLQLVDVLVDGPFVQSLRDEDLLFRGSSNQRIIDVPQSLASGEVVLWQSDMVL